MFQLITAAAEPFFSHFGARETVIFDPPVLKWSFNFILISYNVVNILNLLFCASHRLILDNVTRSIECFSLNSLCKIISGEWEVALSLDLSSKPGFQKWSWAISISDVYQFLTEAWVIVIHCHHLIQWFSTFFLQHEIIILIGDTFWRNSRYPNVSRHPVWEPLI